MCVSIGLDAGFTARIHPPGPVRDEGHCEQHEEHVQCRGPGAQ